MIIGQTAVKIARNRFTPFMTQMWQVRQSSGCFPGGPYYFDVYNDDGVIGSEVDYAMADFLAHVPDDLRVLYHYIEKLEQENATLRQNIRNMIP